MTGFYLCFKILTLLAAVFYPRAVTLRETSSVSIFIYDDFANIDGSHLVNLDSVSKMGSFGTPQSIRTIIGTVPVIGLSEVKVSEVSCLKP